MPIEFFYENDFSLADESVHRSWVQAVIESEDYLIGDISFIFCDDTFLQRLHMKYLGKEDLTDIITFDYVQGKQISGDVYISSERVMENAAKYEADPKDENRRVMSHGILHLMGYGDKSAEETEIMRLKEQEKMMMFHVEQ